MENAAIYARSSKDRSDISPQTQRAALEQLATSRSLRVVETFEDAVESGSTEDRPGFQALLRALKDPARTWSCLLVYDSSRIARRRYIAQAFKHELRRRGIALLYATRPADIDPISEVVLDAVFEAMDEVVSMMSRQKGLAGMAENVRQGWRAGGRAPVGYRLEQVGTGTIREGREVMKSRLIVSDAAAAVRAYLRGRARGVPRRTASRMSGLGLNLSSFIGIEWNALTYAGHTVWNVHREAGAGSKRRPREEWVVNRGTHEALISEREAEVVLAMLEKSYAAQALREARAERSRFLLAGLLYTTDGRAWLGHGKHYRLRRDGYRTGRIVQAELLDQAVIETLHGFRTSEEYIRWLQGEARAAPKPANPADEILGQVRRLERERGRAAEAAIGGEDGGAYEDLVRQKTRQIDALRRELEAVQREAASAGGLNTLSAQDVRELIEAQDSTRVVRQLIGRVVLEPDLGCQIQLRRPSQNELWRPMASPGGFEPPLPP